MESEAALALLAWDHKGTRELVCYLFTFPGTNHCNVASEAGVSALTPHGRTLVSRVILNYFLHCVT
jgi:hypothetical protein